jgi:hypothetical protein
MGAFAVLQLCFAAQGLVNDEAGTEAKLDGLWQDAEVSQRKSNAKKLQWAEVKTLRIAVQESQANAKKLRWAQIMHHVRNSHAPTGSPTTVPTYATESPTTYPTPIPLESRMQRIFPSFNFSTVHSSSLGVTNLLKKHTPAKIQQDSIDEDWGSEYPPG